MDRARFEALLDAYGADLRRWPADERAAAAAFKLQYGPELGAEIDAERRLDEALASVWSADAASDALAARILAARPQPNADDGGFDRRALFALAACAVFGVLLGFGGGSLAPGANDDGVEDYIAMAFDGPLTEFGDEG